MSPLKAAASVFGVGLLWTAYDGYQNVDGFVSALEFAAQYSSNETILQLNETAQGVKGWVESHSGQPPTWEDLANLISENFLPSDQALIAEILFEYVSDHRFAYPNGDIRESFRHLAEIADENGVSFEETLKTAIRTSDVAQSNPSILKQLNSEHCFVAGTAIDMWDGTQKPIEQIRTGDVVLSFDDLGKLVPGNVANTSVTHNKEIFDFHGTGVTPGHVFLCGDGKFKGKFDTLINILRDDGAVVTRDGRAIRAATGEQVGSIRDQQYVLTVIGEDNSDGNFQFSAKKKLEDRYPLIH